ncbi:hypothetical protein B0I31_104115 [Saccharothrix carnea]|uniref:Uncharacterized protein n=1 Tax=Saccharothrix carnea TaxID=1280637 RepID=A0A2P8IBH1_SACCR|nr:hypothetical protein [Saccharothrix carnea]PSL55824.1 hypothetical protein B0I31_104115 [Saccharothrix carnea]
MAAHTGIRPVVAPADIAQLGRLVAEPEPALADPPLPEPNAAGILLLLLSPPTPKEPRK